MWATGTAAATPTAEKDVSGCFDGAAFATLLKCVHGTAVTPVACSESMRAAGCTHGRRLSGCGKRQS
jgi:hypothetical protein